MNHRRPKGALSRQGAGRIKHLTLKQLWVQQHIQAGMVIVHKIPRTINVADLTTHHWTTQEWRNLGQWVPAHWSQEEINLDVKAAVKDKRGHGCCVYYIEQTKRHVHVLLEGRWWVDTQQSKIARLGIDFRIWVATGVVMPICIRL